VEPQFQVLNFFLRSADATIKLQQKSQAYKEVALMNMDKDTIQKIVVMYLSSNEETKQEIKDVLKYLDMLVKVKS
jgi:HPt (histidine-containing phosphotransfer) domain-containing protein